MPPFIDSFRSNFFRPEEGQIIQCKEINDPPTDTTYALSYSVLAVQFVVYVSNVDKLIPSIEIRDGNRSIKLKFDEQKRMESIRREKTCSNTL